MLSQKWALYRYRIAKKYPHNLREQRHRGHIYQTIDKQIN